MLYKMFSLAGFSIVVPYFNFTGDHDRIGTKESFICHLRYTKVPIDSVMGDEGWYTRHESGLLVSADRGLQELVLFERVGSLCLRGILDVVSDVIHNTIDYVPVNLARIDRQSEIISTRRNNPSIWLKEAVLDVVNFLKDRDCHSVLANVIECTGGESAEIYLIGPTCLTEFKEGKFWTRCEPVVSAILVINFLHVVALFFKVLSLGLSNDRLNFHVVEVSFAVKSRSRTITSIINDA